MEPGFFTPIAAMEDGSGFQIGSLPHLAYLAYSAILITSIVVIYRHLSEDTSWGSPRRSMMLILALAAFCLKLTEIALMIRNDVYGVFWVATAPLQHLRIAAGGICLWPNLFSGEVLYALGIPGGAAGMLFADWIKRTTVPLNWFCWCGFTEHSMIVAFPLMLIAAHDFRPSMKRIWEPVVFVCVGAPIFRVFNTHFGTNYWFVNTPSPGSPLERWANIWGNPGYLVPYAVTLFVIWFLMYLPWEIADRRRRRSN